MTIHALLALAAEPEVSLNEVHATYHAYFPRLAAATTMLDSYADRPEDHANENHSYIAHYPSYTTARQAIQRLLTRAIEDTQALPNAPRTTPSSPARWPRCTSPRTSCTRHRYATTPARSYTQAAA